MSLKPTSIADVKALLGEFSEFLFFMEEGGVCFVKPKPDQWPDENTFKKLTSKVEELGGKYADINTGFIIPLAKKPVIKPEEVAVERITYSAEWYDRLILDCQHIIEKMEFDFVRGKWTLGKRIKKDWSKLDVPYGEITKTKRELAKDLGLRTRELYELIRLVERCPDEESFATVSQKFGSWRKVTREYLPEPKPPTEEKKPSPIHAFQMLKLYYPVEIMSQVSPYVPKEIPKKRLRNIIKTFIQIVWELVSEHEETKRLALSRLKERIET